MSKPRKKPLKHHISREELMASKTKDVATDELIDWLAALAHEGKHDWGFIREELLIRCEGHDER